MASTYSPNLRLELIGTGEQQGTWGATTNTNLGTLLEEAIGGYTSVTVADAGDTTLTTANGAADQSRNMTLNLSGTLTATRNVICPAIEKIYVVKNATSGGFAVTFKVTGQTGVSIPNGATMLIYVDGVDARQAGAIVGASNAVLATSIELGGTTDTTITRSAAGVIAVEGGVVPKENRANTFTANQTINGGNVTINSNNSYDPQIKATHAGAVAGSASYYIFSRARGTYETPTSVSSGDALGTILFDGHDGTAFRNSASITAVVDNTPGASDMPGRLSFSTSDDGGSTPFERMRIDSSGNVGIGGTSGGARLDVQIASGGLVQNWTGTSGVYHRLGTATSSLYTVHNGSTDTFMYTQEAAALRLGTSATERMRIDASGNVLVTGAGGLGYGTGSGGTVTQATNKATGVTLNKTNGQITMNNAALAANTIVSFIVTNSTVSATDTVIINIPNTGINPPGKYRIWAAPAAGSFNVYLENATTGSLSDALVLNFSVIKAVTS